MPASMPRSASASSSVIANVLGPPRKPLTTMATCGVTMSPGQQPLDALPDAASPSMSIDDVSGAGAASAS